MKKICILLSILLLSGCSFAKEIVVPKGTCINVQVRSMINSKNHQLRKTYRIPAIITDDVMIGKDYVFYSGDSAVLSVEDMHKAYSFGRGGYIKVNGAYVEDAAGNIRFGTMEPVEFKGSNAFPLARILPFKKGKQAVITPTDIFTVKTSKEYVFDGERMKKDYKQTIEKTKNGLEYSQYSRKSL